MEFPKFKTRKAKKIIPPFQDSYDVSPEAKGAIVSGFYSITVAISHGFKAGDASIIEGRQAQVTLTSNNGWYLPASISVENATFSYNSSTGVVSLSEPTNDVSISAECVPSIGVSVTGGTYSGDNKIVLGTGTASVTIVPSAGYILPTSVSVTGASHSYDSASGVISLSNATGIVSISAVCVAVDPVLENNTWNVIKMVCESGRASSVWSVGDTKNVVGGDTYTRPVMIVDMQGLYGKHVVFQFRQTTSNDYVWNASSNLDDGDCYNNYLISNMNVLSLSSGGDAFVELMGNGDLSSQLTNTTVKVSKNGKNTAIRDVTNKLFLPAEREIFASRSYSRQEEWDALTRYQYYAANDSSAARKLANPSTGNNALWWLRSPYSGLTDNVCDVSSGGISNYDLANYARGVAPCFAF